MQKGPNLFGFGAEEVQQIAKAAAAGAVGPLADKIVDLSQKLGLTQGAALGILRSLGHDDVPIERLPNELNAAAAQIVELRQALSRPSRDEGDVVELKRQAIYALDAGAFDEAKRLLNVIRVQEREASERRRRALEESRADWLAGLQLEAETCALLGRAALGQRDVFGACAHFEEGLRVLSLADPRPRWSYAFDAAAALYDFGNRAGRNNALVAAIHLSRLDWRWLTSHVSRHRSTGR